MPEQDVTAALAVISQRLDEIDRKLDKTLDDHEIRLRRVEKWVYALPPTVLIALGTAIATILNR